MIDHSARVAFVTVGRFSTPWPAWSLRNKLAEAGIDAFVHDEFLVSLNWFYASAIGGIKVQVPGQQEEEARAVISRGNSRVFSSLPRIAAAADARKCRKCGSTEIHDEVVNTRRFLLWFLIIGIPIPVFSSATECYECGRRAGPSTSYRFGNMQWVTFLLTIVALVFVALFRQIGHGWFDAAAMPNWLSGITWFGRTAMPTMIP